MKAEKHATFKSGVIALVIGLVAGAVLFRVMGVIGILFALPVVAWGAGRVFVDMTHGAISSIGDSHLEEWEGNYYEFAGVQVRVYELDGRLWFAAADVIKALGMQASPKLMLSQNVRGCRQLPGEGVIGLTDEATEKLVLSHSPPEAARFVRWMRHEVVVPWERKRVGALSAR